MGEPELAQVDSALDYILAQQEPFPAFVMDRHWNLKRANKGAARLVEFILGAVPEGTVNLADAATHAQLRGERVRENGDRPRDRSPESSSLLARLLSYEGMPELLQSAALEDAPSRLLPMHLRKSGISLHLFTTIATLGTPQDITVQEIRIESFFPMDEPTTRFFREPAVPCKG